MHREPLYLLRATLTRVEYWDDEDIKFLALRARGEGKRSHILTEAEARDAGLLGPMQDLTEWRRDG